MPFKGIFVYDFSRVILVFLKKQKGKTGNQYIA